MVPQPSTDKQNAASLKIPFGASRTQVANPARDIIDLQVEYLDINLGPPNCSKRQILEIRNFEIALIPVNFRNGLPKNGFIPSKDHFWL